MASRQDTGTIASPSSVPVCGFVPEEETAHVMKGWLDQARGEKLTNGAGVSQSWQKKGTFIKSKPQSVLKSN